MKPEPEQEQVEDNLKRRNSPPFEPGTGRWKVILGLCIVMASLAMIWTAWGKPAKLHTFPVDKPNSDSSPGRSAERVCWGTENVIIATFRNRLVQAFDANTGKEIWRQEFANGVDAIECNADHVYVALDSAFPQRAKIESIRRFNLADGTDSTPAGIPQPFLVQALVWCEELKSLCVVHHEGIWIYAPDLMSVKSSIPYSGTLPDVTSNGKLILLAEASGRCTSANLGDGSTKHIHGPPPKGRGDGMPAIDAPFSAMRSLRRTDG